jgi:diaminopimelate epimerase
MLARIVAEDRVSVTLPPPSFEPATLPFRAEWPQDEIGRFLPDGLPLSLPQDLAFGVVSVGNPHVIIEVASVTDACVEQIGSFFQNHVQFPESVNVNFVQILDRQTIKLRINERGVGETRACGSGASATMAALRRQGRVDDTVSVQMLAGELCIAWSGQVDDTLQMQGPATFVYAGQIPWLEVADE